MPYITSLFEQAEAWKAFLDDLDDKINKQKRFSI